MKQIGRFWVDVDADMQPEEHWINRNNVVLCDHRNSQLLKVVGAYGNAVWICYSCLRPVKRELTPTAL